eukprot:TRINITY_DN19815_c0_g5_i1.p1 TRINITY_DN19815_c0_g5~~TRINITY_DN19815_c0_g5_i1.p1  ORF type:complete len:155 (+),score=22.21 TRINITY_DN19815_c0_g5_i1:87-551(+)
MSAISQGSSAVKKYLRDLNSVVMDAGDIIECCAYASLGSLHSAHLLSLHIFSEYMYICKIGEEIQKLRQRGGGTRVIVPFLQNIAFPIRHMSHCAEGNPSVAESPNLSGDVLSDEGLSVGLEKRIKGIFYSWNEWNREVLYSGWHGWNLEEDAE